jgi:hypothetical protein
MKITDIGSGLCVIEDLFNVDPKFTIEYINFLRKLEQDTFTYVEENGKKYAVNRTGFKFDLESVAMAPERFIDPLCKSYEQKPTEEQVKLVQDLESYLYKVLVEYCKLYPDAATVCWWRSHGHFATYSNGQRIGSHCDDQIPYEESMGASNEYPKHAKVSINIYMNDCVESEDQLDGTNFTGGAIRFRHAKYEHKPKMGTAVIYPANYIGTHEVTPVTGGIRVAYLGSFLYGSPENSSPNDSRIWMKNLKEDCNFFQRKI